MEAHQAAPTNFAGASAAAEAMRRRERGRVSGRLLGAVCAVEVARSFGCARLGADSRPLCEGATADPFHVIHECQHSDVVAARASARAKAIRYIPILLVKVEKAAEGAGRFSQPPPAGGWRVSRNLLESHSWETTPSGNLLLRLLAAAPWPAAAVDVDDAPLARHLGRCFDAARLSNTSLHPVYNSWCGFGSRASLALFAAYASAVTAAQQ